MLEICHCCLHQNAIKKHKKIGRGKHHKRRKIKKFKKKKKKTKRKEKNKALREKIMQKKF
jgi:hypothetical protein